MHNAELIRTLGGESCQHLDIHVVHELQEKDRDFYYNGEVKRLKSLPKKHNLKFDFNSINIVSQTTQLCSI